MSEEAPGTRLGTYFRDPAHVDLLRVPLQRRRRLGHGERKSKVLKALQLLASPLGLRTRMSTGISAPRRLQKYWDTLVSRTLDSPEDRSFEEMEME
jgi:hypothetical protein